MRVVAIGNDRVYDAEGDPLDPGRLVGSIEPGEVVLVHDLGASIRASAVDDAASIVGAGVDVVVGSWTFPDAAHGTVRRRGVMAVEHLRWTASAGPAIVVSGDALLRSGWATDGHASFHDLALRLVEVDRLVVESTADEFGHVDDWSLTAPDVAAAVERHLARCGVAADVRAVDGIEPSVVVERVPAHDLTVSLIVPTTGRLTDVRGTSGRLVVNLLDSLFALTALPRDRFDVVLVTGPEVDPTLEGVVRDRYPGESVRIVTSDDPFSHSGRTNLGVVASTGRVVVLLNDDVEIVSPTWLGEIASAATEPGVGLVGPLLRYPDGSIQSAGHAHPHANISEPLAQVAPSQERAIGRGRDVAGVTLACAAVERGRYLAAGGLSARIHNAFNDVDIAMKLDAAGLRHVSLGHIEAIHLETATRAPGVQGFEAAVLYDRWASAMTTERLHFTDEIHEAVRA